MATEAQILANQKNAQLSTGPSKEGSIVSSRNRLKHGLCHTDNFFSLLPGENPEDFANLYWSLREEHNPQDTVESILVRRMAESEWLRARAVSLQTDCLYQDGPDMTKRSALFIRYQTTHERAFYKALKEFETRRAEKTKAEIGFESHKLKQEALEFKKAVFEIKNCTSQRSNSASQNGSAPPITPQTDPGGIEMAA